MEALHMPAFTDATRRLKLYTLEAICGKTLIMNMIWFDLTWFHFYLFNNVQMCQRTFLFGLSMKHMPLFSCTSILHILPISIIQFVTMFLIQSFWTYFCKEFCVFCFLKESDSARNEIRDIYIDFLRFH